MSEGTTVDKVRRGSVRVCSGRRILDGSRLGLERRVACDRRGVCCCLSLEFVPALCRSFIPIFIHSHSPTFTLIPIYTQGENARLSSFIGAMAVADLVKTTLGPCGLDKILQHVSEHNQSISVTNDGATILKQIHVDNPAARVLVELSQVQDEQVGDGTTSVVVLAGELLRQAEDLVSNQHIHPQTICQGYRLALDAARQCLESHLATTYATNVTNQDAAFSAALLEIAKTTLSSKLLLHEKTLFAQLAVDAVLRLQGSPNLNHIQVLKVPGGSLRDSYLEDGFLLAKAPGLGQPKRVEQAKILVANTSMDTDKIKIYGSRVKVDSLDKVADIEAAEKLKMSNKVSKILATGCNVFINRQLIYNYPESLFANAGIMAIEHADFDGVERLAAVTGGDVVSTFDHKVKLGECDLIEMVCACVCPFVAVFCICDELPCPLSAMP